MTTSSPPPRVLGVAQLDCWPRPLLAGVGQWAGDPGGRGVANPAFPLSAVAAPDGGPPDETCPGPSTAPLVSLSPGRGGQ